VHTRLRGKWLMKCATCACPSSKEGLKLNAVEAIKSRADGRSQMKAVRMRVSAASPPRNACTSHGLGRIWATSACATASVVVRSHRDAPSALAELRYSDARKAGRGRRTSFCASQRGQFRLLGLMDGRKLAGFVWVFSGFCLFVERGRVLCSLFCTGCRAMFVVKAAGYP